MLSGPPVSRAIPADQLLDRFLTAASRQRRSQLGVIRQRFPELLPLIPEVLARADRTGEDWAPAWLLQLALAGAAGSTGPSLLDAYPGGWLQAGSASGLDYAPLQHHLALQDFEAADRLTSEHLRQLAGSAAVARGYVYFSEVAAISDLDLESLDRLWLVYSQGRFGFSVQGRLLAACGGQWERLWQKLGWKSDGVWTRYPHAFTWSLEAPEGHMPLINQLRGVRLIDALQRHPALAARIARSLAA